MSQTRARCIRAQEKTALQRANQELEDQAAAAMLRARSAEDALQQQSRERSAEVYELREKLRWHAENSEMVDSNHARLHQQVYYLPSLVAGTAIS